MAVVSQAPLVTQLADGGIRKHQCPSCPRAFKRSEHCQRHARSHTQEKPFPCRYCSKPYSRKDLVSRHEKTLHADQYQPLDRSSDSSSKARRASVARTESQSSSSGSPAFPLEASTNPRDGKCPQDGGVQHASAATSSGNTVVNDANRRTVFNHHGEQTQVQTGEGSADIGQPEQNDSDSLISRPNATEFTDPPLDLYDLVGTDVDPLTGMGLFDTFFDASLDDYTALFQGDASANGVHALAEEQNGSVFQQSLGLASTGPFDELSQIYASSTPMADIAHADLWRQPPDFPQASLPSPSISHDSSAANSDVVISDIAVSSMLNSDFFASSSFTHERPQASTLRLCLRTYFEAFNVHLPLFHTATFDCEQQPAALLLAMAAIGALYRLERRTTAVLFIAAEKSASAKNAQEGIGNFDLFGTSATLDSAYPSVPGNSRSLADVQTRLLLSFFGIFSGNQKLIEKALSQLGETGFAYQSLAKRVKAQTLRGNDITWSEWIEAESTKRVLHGMWIMSNLITTTYDVAPPFSINHDGDIEMPCPDAQWNASSGQHWARLRRAQSTKSCLSIRDAVVVLASGDAGETSTDLSSSSLSWSPFAAVVITHVLATQLWHATHTALPWTLDMRLAGGPAPSDKGDNITEAFTSALARCHELVAPSIDASGGGWIENEDPLLFNAFAILRVCYGRAVPALSCLDRSGLLRGEPGDTSAIHEYVAAPLARSKQVTSAVARAFEGIWIPSRKGALLVRKTAALTWSIEHAIAGWDTMLLISKWTHEICAARAAHAPVEQDENELLEIISAMLRQTDCDTHANNGSSLAAKLARYWATFYDDTWVWGVSLRMATLLRSLADAYK